jgi:hypothetical protein
MTYTVSRPRLPVFRQARWRTTPGDLCGVREVEVIDGQDPHHAGLLSAVPLGAVVELLD